MIFEVKYLSCYSLLTDQISLSGCLYFGRYWAIRVFQLFANQAVTSLISRLTYLSNQAVFSRWPKDQDKNLGINQDFSKFLPLFLGLYNVQSNVIQVFKVIKFTPTFCSHKKIDFSEMTFAFSVRFFFFFELCARSIKCEIRLQI